jgi:hypothetical protein
VVRMCHTVAHAPPTRPQLDRLGGEPFEIDDANRPHLFGHEHYGEQDLNDILEDDRFLTEAEPDKGDADWIMVGQPPGEPPLAVPLAPSAYGNVRRARPIGIYPASGEVLKEYLAWRKQER